jgi:hypothetical protein
MQYFQNDFLNLQSFKSLSSQINFKKILENRHQKFEETEYHVRSYKIKNVL